MEEGLTCLNEKGAPQGSILSPLLSNIYLHYVLDLWFERRVRKRLGGEAYLFRYADDFVLCFQYPEEAQRVREALRMRLEQFGLELAEEKTHLRAFGRFEATNARREGRKPGSFVFLGFRFVCGQTGKGYFKVKRFTAGNRLRRSLRDLKAYLDANYARQRKGDLMRVTARVVEGHLAHFAITDNLRACETYQFHAQRFLFRALSRKSQRRPYTWRGFQAALRHVRWPRVRLRHNLDPCRPMWTQPSLKGFA
jgi:hypothetical protein